MENKNIIYVIGGGIALVVLFVLMRGRGSAPTVIQTGGQPTATGGNEGLAAQLTSQGIQADVFKTLASGVFGSEQNRLQSQLGLAGITASRDVGLAQTGAAAEVARAQGAIQSQAIAAARDVGLVQASNDLTRAQLENEGLRSQQRNQTTQNLLNGLFSTLGNVLRAIGSQPRSSGGATGGATGGASTQPRTSIFRTPPFVSAPGVPYIDILGPDFYDFTTPTFFPSDFETFFPAYIAETPYTGEPTITDVLTGEPLPSGFIDPFGQWFENEFGPPPEYGGSGSGGSDSFDWGF